MLVGIGADVNYYVAPDQATQDMLAAQGRTWEVVEAPSNYTVNAQGEVTSADQNTGILPSPPVPIKPALTDCPPTNSACVAENQRKDIIYEQNLQAYNKALNANYDPASYNAYMASVASGAIPAGGAPAASFAPQQGAFSTQVGGDTKAQAPTSTPVIQPTVQTGAAAAPVPIVQAPSGTTILNSTVGGIPTWALLGAAVAAFFVFGGKRK